MKIDQTVLGDLDLARTAVDVLNTPLLQMPVLLSERALKDAPTTLASEARALASNWRPISTETIGMPKRTYGTRPVTLVSPAVRVLYESLVKLLEPALGRDSRGTAYSEHLKFGIDSKNEPSLRFVDIDIAACYEYINHETLGDELILQGMDFEKVHALQVLLRQIFPSGVGLPQAVSASHRLADTYLDKMQRAIERVGRLVHRYADDFRIVSDGWSDAHAMIELAANEARRVGLTLSDGKARIRSSGQIRDQLAEAEKLFEDHKKRAADSLRTVQFVQVGYDDFDVEEVDASDLEVDAEALRRIVEDWVSHDREHDTIHPRLATRAIELLATVSERLKDELLNEILEREPSRMPTVSLYISTRSNEAEQNWETLSKMTQLSRFGPWSRLWVLTLAGKLEPTGTDAESSVISWCTASLSDPHETIRSESAWVLARHGKIKIDEIAKLFVSATDVSKVAVAAAAGRLDHGSRSSAGRAIRNDSQVARSAYDWGASQA